MDKDLQDSTLLELLFWLLKLRRRYRVTGASMSPHLAPNDEVLVDPRAYRGRPPQLNDIVVARHPYKEGVQIIKRIVSRQHDGRYLLEGDNPAESTDSRSFGTVSAAQILGQVTSRFP